MDVWIVNADDHDYDYMSQWCVGVFSSEEKANAAAQADRRRYNGPLKRRGGPNYEILAVRVDAVLCEHDN